MLADGINQVQVHAIRALAASSANVPVRLYPHRMPLYLDRLPADGISAAD
jgi:hypothetical protein